jgi:hypothetical protein
VTAAKPIAATARRSCLRIARFLLTNGVLQPEAQGLDKS